MRIALDVSNPEYNAKGLSFQDEALLEEGMAMDNQVSESRSLYLGNTWKNDSDIEIKLWGSTIACLAGEDQSSFAPVVTSTNWPFSHARFQLQNQKSVDAGKYQYFSKGTPVSSYPYRLATLFSRNSHDAPTWLAAKGLTLVQRNSTTLFSCHPPHQYIASKD